MRGRGRCVKGYGKERSLPPGDGAAAVVERGNMKTARLMGKGNKGVAEELTV
jgi:hypothetical protein